MSEPLSIPVKGIRLDGQLDLTPTAPGLVLFAHGSGSSRHSPRNQRVASLLREAGLATLLFDLLTTEEEESETQTGRLRFNIPFLAERLAEVTRWTLDQATPRNIRAAYFGSSTGAAAALVAAAQLGETVAAIVSRGGRPDLAGEALEKVSAPTLLIVGANDTPVISLNEQAFERLRCEKALRIVNGASHLFEEPGKLDLVARMAAEWFLQSASVFPATAQIAARPNRDYLSAITGVRFMGKSPHTPSAVCHGTCKPSQSIHLPKQHRSPALPSLDI